jgi:uncharacterized membrane protein
MKKWLLWTGLGTLVVAIVMHVLTLAAVPVVIMNGAMAKYPANQLMKGSKTNAQSRLVVRPSPDLVYSIVSYDVSKESIHLTAKVPTDTYWSLSCFQQNTDNYFVVNDRQVKSNPAEFLLIKKGMQVSDAGNVQVIISPTDRGVLLIRHLLTSDDKYQELVDIQKQSSLKVGNAPDAPAAPGAGGLSFEAAEYLNPAYGFSVRYPRSWQPGATAGKQVFVAAAAARVPTISISVRDEASFADAVKTALADTGNTEINMMPEKPVKLSDGTAATQCFVKFKVKAGYDAEALALGVPKDGKIIVVIVTTVSLLSPYNEAQFSEILQTFKLTK